MTDPAPRPVPKLPSPYILTLPKNLHQIKVKASNRK